MDKIKDGLALASVAILIMSTANSFAYYDSFSIDIFSYLDFTEVIQLQFRYFAVALGFFVLSTIYQSVANRLSDNNGEHPGEKAARERRERGEPEPEIIIEQAKNSKNSEKGKSLTFLMNNKGFIIGSIMALAVGIIEIYSPYSNTTYEVFWIVSIVLFIIGVIITNMRYLEIETRYEENNDVIASKSETYFWISFLTILIYASGAAGKVIALRRLSGYSSYEVTAKLENRTISTNKNYVFVGRSKNYVFFYNIPQSEAEIFAVGDIKSIVIKNGLDHSKALK